MMRGLRIALLVALAGVAVGCAKKPSDANPMTRVSVQRPTTGNRAPHTDWSATVFPARYADPELPAFPPEAVAAEVTGATVRADFTVLPDGQAHDVRLALAEDVAEGQRFIDACAEVLRRWRFSPAWRLRRKGEAGEGAVVLVPSKAQLVFRFDLGAHLAGGDVEMTFGPDGG